MAALDVLRIAATAAEILELGFIAFAPEGLLILVVNYPLERQSAHSERPPKRLLYQLARSALE
jgi:hypothetical protein